MTTTPQAAPAPEAKQVSPVAAAMLAKNSPAEQSELEALRAQLAEAQAKLAEATAPVATTAGKPKQFPKYIMPITNCNITLPNGKRVFTADGVIVADSHYLEEYLEEMVAVGNCYRFQEGDAVSSFQSIPA